MKKGFLLCMAAILVSCGVGERGADKSSCVVIDMETMLGKKVSDRLEFNDIADVVGVVAIDDSILFERVSPVGDADACLIMQEHKENHEKIFLVDKETGSVVTVIDKRGNGPGEYNTIFEVEVDNAEETIYIYDINKNNILKYSFSGKYLETIQQNLGSFRVLKDGNYAAAHNPFLKKPECFNIYDRNFNIIRESELFKAPRKDGGLYIDRIMKYDGECYYRKPDSDTLFRITTEYEEPFMVLYKGRYQMPDKELAEGEYKKYITGGNHVFSTKYYFYEYGYNDKLYMEIWDMRTEKPVYRTVMDRDNWGNAYGIPVKVGNERIRVWPSCIFGDNIYCSVYNYENAVKIVPGLKEDDNPVILHLRIK